MKLETSNKTGKSSQPLEEIDFGIGNTALVLEYLRNHIYKNPIMALTREYASNARDAHREVGKDDQPIEITLPTRWDPNWKCQDFGPGIDPSRMDETFTKFGNSTKRDTNEQTGAYGLGCKSGWAYGDSFNVITVVSGIKYFYSAILDGSNGKMVLLHKENTDECNGTTVIIPAGEDDFQHFEDYTILATSFWDPLPILKGRTPAPEYHNPDVLYQNDSWKLCKKFAAVKGMGNGANVVLDGIPYSIESFNLNVTYHNREIFNCSLYFNFNIGDLDLSPSRDNLRYTDKTIKAIRDRIDPFIKELIEIFEDKVSNASSYLEACKAYKVLRESVPSPILRKLPTPKWNDISLVLSMPIYNIGKYTTLWCFWFEYSKLRSSRTLTSLDILDPATLILFNDDERSMPRSKFQALLEDPNTSYKRIQVVACPSEPKDKGWEYIKQKHPSTRPTYDMNLLRRLKPKNLSTYPLPKGKKSVGKGRKSVSDGNVMAYDICTSVSGCFELSCYEVPNTGGVYVEADYKNKQRLRSGNITIHSPRDFKIMSALIGKDVVGFTETRIKKLTTNWITFEDALKEKVNEVLSNYSLEDLKAAKHSESFRLERALSACQAVENDINDKDSLMLKYFQQSKEVGEILKEANNIWMALQYLGYDLGYHKETDLQILHKKVIERYELIGHIRYDVSAEKIKNYINIVDLAFKNKTKSESNVISLVS